MGQDTARFRLHSQIIGGIRTSGLPVEEEKPVSLPNGWPQAAIGIRETSTAGNGMATCKCVVKCGPVAASCTILSTKEALVEVLGKICPGMTIYASGGRR